MNWIIGGTKDSRKFIEKIMTLPNKNFIVTVATPYGKKLLEEYSIDAHIKPMNIEEMIEFINFYKIKNIFDFSHPYAVEVSSNAITAAKNRNISYYRFQREEIENKDNESFNYFDDIDSIITYINNINDNILVTLGSNSIEKFKDLPNLKNIYFRVLPTEISIVKLEKNNILPKNIIGLQGPFSHEFNEAIYRNYNIKYLITKESGNTGGETEKLESASKNNITTLILKRPKLTYPWVSDSIEEIYCEFLKEANEN